MNTNFLSADRIHNGRQWLPAGTVLELDDEGRITKVHPAAPGKQAVRHYQGLLCPGFVNAHCHVELSHMKGQIPEHTGLIPFLLAVLQRRNGFTEEQKTTARHAAVQEMEQNGIVAVGDIANTTDTLHLRERLHWHTFVESIGFTPERAEAAFAYALSVWEAFARQPCGTKVLRQSIVPHAPYSVSQALFQLIGQHQQDMILSIHNQETADENAYYQDKSGGFSAFLAQIGIDDTVFAPHEKASLPAYGAWLPQHKPVMLVHNTFSTADDVSWAQQRFPQLYWCLCPNANRYIENRLPDIPMLDAQGAVLCIGTDSLASNHQLSVWAELQTIQAAYPALGWEKLLRWATYNGACALQMQDRIGSLEAGKTPGIVWIDDTQQVHRLY
jgi:cytosine/adenosine deaminase-related metal-dependent hydrolase